MRRERCWRRLRPRLPECSLAFDFFQKGEGHHDARVPRTASRILAPHVASSCQVHDLGAGAGVATVTCGAGWRLWSPLSLSAAGAELGSSSGMTLGEVETAGPADSRAAAWRRSVRLTERGLPSAPARWPTAPQISPKLSGPWRKCITRHSRTPIAADGPVMRPTKADWTHLVTAPRPRPARRPQSP